ncbi:MAG: AAA family ATPase, partial [Myxococcales bacterium]|nr:AAA family ATPase [Myxococcales bacterium]
APLAHHRDAILKKKVSGKDDVDVAAIIIKLDNSDWVRQGLPYYEVNDQVCPFCQQETGEAFAASLKEYFDETFELGFADRLARRDEEQPGENGGSS